MTDSPLVHVPGCSCDICNPVPLDVLSALHADDYRLDLDLNSERVSLQVVPYEPLNPAYGPLVPHDFLSRSWIRLRDDRILRPLFCGLTNLSHDAIVAYLASKPLLIGGEWTGDSRQFRPLALGFIVTWIGVAPPQPGPRSAFAAYALFREAWGTEKGVWLGMLGLARMMRTWNLSAIYGQRYLHNRLTSRFMARYGFEDIGVVPEFLLEARAGQLRLTDCAISRLRRQDLVLYVETKLVSLVK